MNQQPKFQPLALPPSNVVGAQAFDRDLLARKKLADQLTGYLDRLQVGAVLAIDAQWGEGKTWFGHNWKMQLESESHKVVFIDAFAQDYVEDPFLLIAAEITSMLDKEEDGSKELREKAAKVMKALLPTAAKAMINLAGRVALGSADLVDEFKEAAQSVKDGVADITSKLIERKLEDHTKEKESLEHFKKELAKFAVSQNKPIVIFIDELDRCRPTFAVELIERIKHFFDVPNLIFVLLLNRDQLENAIRGVYGPKTDAAMYLGKFIHLFFRLPKNSSRDQASNSHSASMFIGDVLTRYGFATTQENMVNSFRDDLLQWVIAANLSLRDIERACALFVMSCAPRPGFLSSTEWETAFITYLIVLKIKYPDLCGMLMRNETRGHKEAMNFLDRLLHERTVEAMVWPDLYFKALFELHQLQFKGDVAKYNNVHSPCLEKVQEDLFGRGFSKERCFFKGFNRIDLPIETV